MTCGNPHEIHSLHLVGRNEAAVLSTTARGCFAAGPSADSAAACALLSALCRDPLQRAGEDWRVLLFKSQVGSSKAPEIQVRLSVHPHGQPTSGDRGPLVKTSKEREPVGKLWD